MSEQPTPQHPRALIEAELLRRIQKNPRYSLRAFARATGISHTILSLVMSGKRPLSRGAAEKLAEFLGLDPQRREQLLAALPKRRKALRLVDARASEFHAISLDTFSVISDWYHYAILCSLSLPGAKLEPRWISKQLGISLLEARMGIDRLKRLQMVALNEEGVWVESVKPIKIENKVATSATRKFQRQLLEKAIHSIENDPIEIRDFNSMTFAMDPSLIPYAEKRITEFKRQLTAELRAQGKPGAVYQMVFQMYPVTPVAKATSNPNPPQLTESSET